MSTTYWDYLRIHPLLSLQDGLGPHTPSPDELHFIVVHQVFELWFKLSLSQLRLARDHLATSHVPEEQIPFVVHHLRRVNEILRVATEHFSVVETLAPQDFLSFRDSLIPASGFQSFQMRELELILGLGDDVRVRYGSVEAIPHLRDMASSSPTGKFVIEHLERALAEESLRSALHRWLARTPIHGSTPADPGDAARVDGFLHEYLHIAETWQRSSIDKLVSALGEAQRQAVTARVEASIAGLRRFLLPDDPALRRVHAGLLFIESYRDLPLLAWPRLLLETVVALEEQLLIFRHRHARMAERVIGRRVGTGGSAGVEYLDQTTAYRIFPELWAVRAVLVPRDALPPVENGSMYGFAG